VSAKRTSRRGVIVTLNGLQRQGVIASFQTDLFDKDVIEEALSPLRMPRPHKGAIP
jgi:hypothetical protein